MTREVWTCTRDSSIGQHVEQMIDGHIRHLPFVDQGALVGVVGVGDAVKQRHDEVPEVGDTVHRYIREDLVRSPAVPTAGQWHSDKVFCRSDKEAPVLRAFGWKPGA